MDLVAELNKVWDELDQKSADHLEDELADASVFARRIAVRCELILQRREV